MTTLLPKKTGCAAKSIRRQKYFSASPSPSQLLVSCYPTSESLVQALDAVLDSTADFYGVCLADTRTDAELLALDTHISGLDHPLMLFLPLIGTPAAVVAANSLLDKLYAAGTKRVIATYTTVVSDAAAVMGTAMGLQTAHAASAFSLCYKSVGGIQPSALTQSQVDAIEALNGNVYVTRGLYSSPARKGKHPVRLSLRRGAVPGYDRGGPAERGGLAPGGEPG